MTRSLSRPELIAWTRLARTPRIGPLTFHRLIARFRTAAAALEALPRVSNLSAPPADAAEREIEAVEQFGARLIACCEPDYPPLLAQLDAPPPVLAVRGDPKWLKKPTIAIVGSREGSGSALMFAERLATDLGVAGYTIASGLARGVDAAVHRGALATGTVGVLAGGAPGSPLDPRARGSNALIKQGATLIEDAADVIAALGESAPPLRPLSAGPLFADIDAPPPPPGLPKKIAALLSPTPIHVNDLARLVEAPAGMVAAALTELELEGRAASLPGGYAAQARAAFD